jgi:hypothetical protein
MDRVDALQFDGDGRFDDQVDATTQLRVAASGGRRR